MQKTCPKRDKLFFYNNWYSLYLYPKHKHSKGKNVPIKMIATSQFEKLKHGCGGPILEGDFSLKNLIKKIGKGPKLSMDLSFDEAHAAMTQILDGTATPAQTGAFLVALRMKSESAVELAGMTKALREVSNRVSHDLPKLLELAPAHDGKNKTPVLSPFVALALAQTGVKVVVTSGVDVPTKKGLTPRAVFQELGHPINATADKIPELLHKCGVAYFDVSAFCPALEKLKNLRDSLGLRTPLNSVEKIIRATQSTHLCTGVYHGPYLKELALACQILGDDNVLCAQATEASTDLPLKKRTLYRRVFNNQISEQQEIDPALSGFKRDTSFEMDCSTANSVVEAVQGALRSRSGVLFDTLIYNVAAQLWFVESRAHFEEAIEPARELVHALKI